MPVAPGGARLELVVREVDGDGDQVERDLEVTHQTPFATVGDLVDAISALAPYRDRVAGTVELDGRAVPRDRPLRSSGLRRGSILTVLSSSAANGRGGELQGETSGETRSSAAHAGPTQVVARTVAGPDAGREIALTAGSHVVGRSRAVDVILDDPAIAGRQAVICVDPEGAVAVTDLCSPRPTRAGGQVADRTTVVPPGELLRMGGSVLEIEPVGVDAAARQPGGPDPCRRHGLVAGWTVGLHRPPPAPAPPPIPAVRLPSSMPPPPAPPSPAGAAIVVTLTGGAVVSLLLHQPTLLILSSIGALGTLATALWPRLRRRARRRAEGDRASATRSAVAADVASHQSAVAARLRADALELPAAVACAVRGGPQLWARRTGDPSAFTAVVGRGDRWQPPALETGGGPVPDEWWAIVEAAGSLHDIPVVVDLGPGAVVGIVGPAAVARALARSLMLQLTVAHGPADLLVAAVTAPASPEPGWLRWLPHARDPDSGDRLVAIGDPPVSLVGRDRSSGECPRHLVLVVDDPTSMAARSAPVRELLVGDQRAAALVVADAVTSLPSICDVVIDARPDGTAVLHRPGRAELDDHVIAAGASLGTAREVALALAGWHDPEQVGPGSALPSAVPLASLLRAGGALDPDEVRRGWENAGSDPPLRTRLAVAADGPVEVDLVRDGPHALVAGTTGAGKSELLRTLVAGLSVGTPPDHLAFVLVDYKGGAAFDACARLPHVAGVVTDLDERLAERALRSLHAELRRREQLLRAACAPDLTAYRAGAGATPIPRLVVVVDELATLAHDLPDFVPSLIGVAQRGRSLGVHLVLATQRPAGAISDDVRANTNLRVALRVLDAAESVDVVGVPDAASLPRHRPGRAIMRFGPEECVVAQVASATGGVSRGAPPVTVALLDELASAVADDMATVGPSALDVLVDAVAGAAAGECAGDRHRPWLPPLAPTLRWEDLPAGAAGLLDDPDHQAQPPWQWDRATGHLLCIGGASSGTTTALTTTVLAAATSAPPSELHVYVVDGGALPDALADLHHVGAVIARTDDERVARLVDRLASRLDGRADGMPPVLVVVDGLATWRQVVAERLGSEVADRLDRVLVEGPAVGIVVAATVERPGALPLAVSGAVGERLVFRLGDPADALVLGLRPAAVADLPRGRAVVAGSGLDVQMAEVGDPSDAVARVVASWPAHPGLGVAPPVDRLPERVAVQHLPEPSLASVTSSGEARSIWSLPIGLDGRTLDVCRMELHPGEHVLVAGPARSGRSSALVLLAHQVRAADPSARIVTLTPRRSPLRDLHCAEQVAGPDELAAMLSTPCPRGTDAQLRTVLVVDDAELVDDSDSILLRLVGGRSEVTVVAAGRIDVLRSAYGHWTQALRRQRCGLLLRPTSDLDGDVLGATLPRREAVAATPGRGYLVADGRCVLVQLAWSDRARFGLAD